MQLRATAGGANIATVGANASASGHYGSNSPDLAFDGSYATFWASSGGGVGDYIAYDFGVATSVAQILISARNDSFFDQSPPALSIDGSNDLATWTPIVGYSGLTWQQSNGTTSTANTFAADAPPPLNVSILRQYEVEGPDSGLFASVLRQYEVEGPSDKIFATVLRQYLIEGPPPPPPPNTRRRPVLLLP